MLMSHWLASPKQRIIVTLWGKQASLLYLMSTNQSLAEAFPRVGVRVGSEVACSAEGSSLEREQLWPWTTNNQQLGNS